MNLGMCFLISMVLPLISCYNLRLVKLELEKAVQKIGSNEIIGEIKTKDFTSDLQNCVVQVGINDPDYSSCVEDLASKNGGFDIECLVLCSSHQL